MIYPQSPLLILKAPTLQGFPDIFRWVVTVIGALQKAYMPYRSLMEALYTLNSPAVVSSIYLEARKTY